MPPRRGGGGDAGAGEASYVKANIPEPPVKRSQPWSLDSANTTEIIAGTFDAGGTFQGMVIGDASLQVITRFFQLGPAFLPKSVAGMDGYPTIIVTRGVYGRDKDTMPGPLRNNAQAAVWNTVRNIRAEMPTMNVTCVDMPANAPLSQLSSVINPPLNDYRELAFYEGTWYIPVLEHTPKLMKSLQEVERKAKAPQGEGKQQVNFKRVKFGWREDERMQNCYQLTWQAVHTEEGYVAPVAPPLEGPEVAERPKLVVCPEKPPKKMDPAEAEKKAEELLKTAKESLSSGKLYSALWAAKQAARISEGSAGIQAMDVISSVHNSSEKPITMGPLLELLSEDKTIVSYVP